MEIILILLYLLIVFYSLLCSPDVWFRYFKYNDSPEYAFLYLFGCLAIGFSLIGVASRVRMLLSR